MSKGPVPIPLEIRFFKKVKKTPTCWLWQGSTVNSGYGHMWDNRRKKPYAAHRLSWEFKNGPIPEGKWILHKCNNPPCVNPKHFYLGNQSDNMRFCSKKGRISHGESHYHAKLTDEDVRFIRSYGIRKKGEGLFLAKKFDIAPGQISAIRNRKKWRHVV